MGDHTTSDRQRRPPHPALAADRRGADRRGCVGFAVAWVIHPANPAASPPAFTSSTSVPVTATIKVTCQDDSGDAARMQQAIDSSPAGSAIEFEGGTRLAEQGAGALPGDAYLHRREHHRHRAQAGTARPAHVRAVDQLRAAPAPPVSRWRSGISPSTVTAPASPTGSSCSTGSSTRSTSTSTTAAGPASSTRTPARTAAPSRTPVSTAGSTTTSCPAVASTASR